MGWLEEVDPNGHEVVICTAGEITLVQEIDGKEIRTMLRPGEMRLPTGRLAHGRREWSRDGRVHHGRSRHAGAPAPPLKTLRFARFRHSPRDAPRWDDARVALDSGAFAGAYHRMPMQWPESLEVLDRCSVAPAQARAFVRAIEIEIAGAKDTLATKHDLLVLRTTSMSCGPSSAAK